MDFSQSPQMCLYQSDLPHGQQVPVSSEDDGMSYFVQDGGQWYCFRSMYADAFTYPTSQPCQCTNDLSGSSYGAMATSLDTSWIAQPANLEQPNSFYEMSNFYIKHVETVSPSPSIQSANTLSPSWDNQSTERDVSPLPTRLQMPATRKLRDATASPTPDVRRGRNSAPSPAPTRVRRSTAQSRGRRPKVVSHRMSPKEQSHRWPRHILVRAKILPNESTTELRYFMVVLRSADVQACASAICSKLGIDSTGHKSMEWMHKKSRSQGMVDSAFLSRLDDMQDFVVDIVGVGNNGYVELLLEM